MALVDKLNTCADKYDSARGCEEISKEVSDAKKVLETTFGFTREEDLTLQQKDFLTNKSATATDSYLSLKEAYDTCLDGIEDSSYERSDVCGDIKTKLDLAKAKADEKLTTLGLDTPEKLESHYKEVVLGKLENEYLNKSAQVGACVANQGPRPSKESLAECSDLTKDLLSIQQVIRSQITSAKFSEDEKKIMLSRIMDQGLEQRQIYMVLYQSNAKLCNGVPCDSAEAVVNKLTPVVGVTEAKEFADKRTNILFRDAR